MLDFYPRPPRGGRHGRAGGVLLLDLFLSTPSARRATFVLPDGWEVDPYFYPRPPRGGRRAGIAPCGHCSEYFYPRPPRGGRLDVLVVLKVVAKFLSTPSARRATSFSFLPAPFIAISIHALREEGDTRSDDQEAHLYISIHALREEGDTALHVLAVDDGLFLSTPSARRATGATEKQRSKEHISIHALREEGDTVYSHLAQCTRLFLSTPSARRATRGKKRREHRL